MFDLNVHIRIDSMKKRIIIINIKKQNDIMNIIRCYRS